VYLFPSPCGEKVGINKNGKLVVETSDDIPVRFRPLAGKR